MAWAGTGILWTVSGGVPRALGIHDAHAAESGGFTFVQISDSHIGFNKEANPDTNGTLQAAIERITKLPKQPAMVPIFAILKIWRTSASPSTTSFFSGASRPSIASFTSSTAS